MGISGIPAIPMIITCLLQGTLCDTGIPRTFYGGKICSVKEITAHQILRTGFPKLMLTRFPCARIKTLYQKSNDQKSFQHIRKAYSKQSAHFLEDKMKLKILFEI